MDSHDPAYKEFFKNKEMVESMLKGYVPESFVRELDFSTLELCSGSYVTDDLRERMDDCVWKVSWNGVPCYLYILLEFQSTPDPWMPVRILGYTALLWQDLIKNGSIKNGDSLPPVFPIVLYNGTATWTTPLSVQDMATHVPPSIKRYQPQQSYFLLDEKRCDPDTPSDSRNLFSYLLRSEKLKTPEEVQALLQILVERLNDPEYLQLRRHLAVWFGRVVFKQAGIKEDIPEFKDLQEVGAMLAETVATWKETWNAQYRDLYIQQGIEAGRLQGIEAGRLQGIEAGRLQGIEAGRLQGIETGREQGIEAGRLSNLASNIRSVMSSFGVSEEKAMDALFVSEEDRKKVKTLLMQ